MRADKKLITLGIWLVNKLALLFQFASVIGLIVVILIIIYKPKVPKFFISKPRMEIDTTSEKSQADSPETKKDNIPPNSDIIRTITEEELTTAVNESLKKEKGSSYKIYRLLIIALILMAYIVFYELKKTRKTKPRYVPSKKNTNLIESKFHPFINEPTEKNSQKSNEKKLKKADKSLAKSILPMAKEGTWLIIGASVAGKSHIESGTMCQDAYAIKQINNNWGLVACCDGAGSAALSQIGAQFVSEKSIEVFFELIKTENWIKKELLPTKEIWIEKAIVSLKTIHSALNQYAGEKEVDPKNFACTLILLIYSPIGMLITHIGDGRAGFLNEAGNWQPLLTPYKGQEANQTIFITSPIWENPQQYIECLVFNENPLAFTVMTDGCESHAFQTYTKDSETEKYEDLNQPFPNFLNPTLSAIREMYFQKKKIPEIEAGWQTFLERGNKRLTEENDDKTLIIGQII